MFGKCSHLGFSQLFASNRRAKHGHAGLRREPWSSKGAFFFSRAKVQPPSPNYIESVMVTNGLEYSESDSYKLVLQANCPFTTVALAGQLKNVLLFGCSIYKKTAIAVHICLGAEGGDLECIFEPSFLSTHKVVSTHWVFPQPTNRQHKL